MDSALDRQSIAVKEDSDLETTSREVGRMQSRLKLFTGEDVSETPVAEGKVAITLGELVSVLSDAQQARRAWLRDFRNDEIQISSDLYDVLSTYWNMRRGA